MKKEKEKDNKRSIWTHVNVVLIGALIGTLFIGGVLFLGEDVKNASYSVFYNHYVDSKNLSYDFAIENNTLGEQPMYYSLPEFETVVENNYVYNDSGKDCKYWSYLWYKYFKLHDVDVKYIDTPYHVYVMAYTKDGYCVVDQTVEKTIDCRGVDKDDITENLYNKY